MYRKRYIPATIIPVNAMYPIRITLALLLCSSLLAACSDPVEANNNNGTIRPKTPEELIVGDWEWVRTWNPWTNDTTTPATAGYNEVWAFFDNGRVRVSKHGAIRLDESYEVFRRVNPSVPTDSTLMIRIGNGESWLTISQDSMKIASSPVDGPDYDFVRLR